MNQKITTRLLISTAVLVLIIFSMVWLFENARAVFGEPLDIVVVGLSGMLIFWGMGYLLEYSSKKGVQYWHGHK